MTLPVSRIDVVPALSVDSVVGGALAVLVTAAALLLLWRTVRRPKRLFDRNDDFQLLIQHASDLVTVIDPTGRVLYASPSVERILGYAQQEVVGEHILNFLHPDDHDRSLERLHSVRVDKQRLPLTSLRFRHARGHWVWLESTSSNLLDHPQVGGIVINSRDVTARERVRRRLEESEQHKQVLLEAIPDLLFELDRDGRYIEVIAPDPELLVAPREKLLRSSIRTALPPTIARRYIAAIRSVIESGAMEMIEYRLAVADGSQRDFEGRLVRASETSVLALVRDVTPRKEYERQLVAAREETEQLLALKTKMLSMLHHEMRTPLSGIIGVASILEDELEGEQQEMAFMVEESGKRLAQTLSDMLMYSELEAEALSPELRPVSLQNVLADVLRAHSLAAQRNGLELQCDRPEGEISVHADYRQLRIILDQLVSNGIKFTKEGYVQISIWTGTATVSICVEDSGIGIAEAFLPQVFEPFQQESAGLARKFEGCGVGLAIAHRLARMMGGSIEAESVQGQGSSFTLTLPLARRPRQVGRSKTTDNTSQTPTPY